MKLRDIACAAGVSLTTVSLVLNGKPGVGPEKRRVVAQLLRDNGYEPRSFDSGSDAAFKTIHFLKYIKHSYLVNGNPGFVTQIVDAVEQECRRNGYNLLITAIQEPDPAWLAELTDNPAAQGVILLGTEIENADMAAFHNFKKPLVTVDNALPGLPFSTITMNNEQAIFSLVAHLVGLGHRRIGFLENSIPSGNDRERRAAFQDALLAHGLDFDPSLIYPIFPTMDGAGASIAELLAHGVSFPPALVANNDSIAIGALRAFKQHGLRIPEDISLTGFDGLPFAAVSEPPLTTVSVPCREIGRWAVHMLQEKIAGRSAAVCKLRVNTALIPRDSTAPPPASES